MKAANSLTPSSLSKAVRNALKSWSAKSKKENPLAQLYLVRKAQREGHGPLQRATNHVLLQANVTLQATNPQAASFIEKRFMDGWQVSRLSNHLNVAQSTIYVVQREALDQFTDTVTQMEQSAWATQQENLLRRLEAPTNTHLVDIDPHLEHLLNQLITPTPPWIVAVEGLGGSGKTSLADAVVRRLIEQRAYDEIGWVSARQTYFNLGGAITAVEQPALSADSLIEALVRQLLPDLATASNTRSQDRLNSLRTRLKEIPHLIVVDNLETLVDLQSLLPTLQELANPTKFLLTSRQSLFTAPNIYHFIVPELGPQSSLQLIRQEASVRNLPLLAACSDAELQPIRDTVGGNPLALRLVVGQTHIHTLESILHDLRQARGESSENLYTYIYRHAWDSLDESSRDVLLTMPLVNPQGDTLEVIATIGEVDVGAVRMALNRLVMLNLIDVRGGLNDRRYSIHGLTRTFLHEQVLRWRR